MSAMPPEHVIAKALSHPLRARVLRLIESGERSPVELAAALDYSVHDVAYHVRQLDRAGLIVRTRVAHTRGAEQHFYKVAVHAQIVARPASANSSRPGSEQ
jgi:DNA-binding MarR family transcriptional regulator